MKTDSYARSIELKAVFIILISASLSSLTTPIGCLLSGYLMDLIGRKRTLIITEVPLILGWLLISFSSCVEMIYVGRLLVGLGSGMVGAPARVYTSEGTLYLFNISPSESVMCKPCFMKTTFPIYASTSCNTK